MENEENKYVMGVDPYGYDGNVATVIVMSKSKDGAEVVAQYKGRPSIDFEAEVKKLAAFYKIPDNHILKEKP